MTWTEKVEFLTRDKVVDRIGREAGWATGELANYVREGTMPSAEKGLRLAKALNVTSDWLFDQSRGLPVPPKGGLVPPEDWSAEDWTALRALAAALRSLRPE